MGTKRTFDDALWLRTDEDASFSNQGKTSAFEVFMSTHPVRSLRCVCVFLVLAWRTLSIAVLRSYGAEVSGPTQEKLFNYIRLLASTGISDEKLLTLGRAYLREILKPNPRYTGC
jgi:hypothetical protein